MGTLYFKYYNMEERKVTRSIYLKDSTFKELQDLEMKAGAIRLLTSNDKIAQLIYLYKESLNK